MENIFGRVQSANSDALGPAALMVSCDSQSTAAIFVYVILLHYYFKVTCRMAQVLKLISKLGYIGIQKYEV